MATKVSDLGGEGGVNGLAPQARARAPLRAGLHQALNHGYTSRQQDAIDRDFAGVARQTACSSAGSRSRRTDRTWSSTPCSPRSSALPGPPPGRSMQTGLGTVYNSYVSAVWNMWNPPDPVGGGA